MLLWIMYLYLTLPIVLLQIFYLLLVFLFDHWICLSYPLFHILWVCDLFLGQKGWPPKNQSCRCVVIGVYICMRRCVFLYVCGYLASRLVFSASSQAVGDLVIVASVFDKEARRNFGNGISEANCSNWRFRAIQLHL